MGNRLLANGTMVPLTDAIIRPRVKRWRRTTIQDPAAQAETLDLIQRHFGPSEVLDARYVGDIKLLELLGPASPTWLR